MPTKKRRVGFIPRSDVLALIDKLSYESNLSFSKIVNILVEEALHKRGLLNIETSEIFDNTVKNNYKINENKVEVVNKEFIYNFNNKLLIDKNCNFKEVKEEPFDNAIYTKFLMFLEFQERMKNRDEST